MSRLTQVLFLEKKRACSTCPGPVQYNDVALQSLRARVAVDSLEDSSKGDVVLPKTRSTFVYSQNADTSAGKGSMRGIRAAQQQLPQPQFFSRGSEQNV